MSVQLDALAAEITKMEGIEESAAAAITAIAAAFLAVKDDPAAIASLAARVTAADDKLAAAIAANPTP